MRPPTLVETATWRELIATSRTAASDRASLEDWRRFSRAAKAAIATRFPSPHRPDQRLFFRLVMAPALMCSAPELLELAAQCEAILERALQPRHGD